MTNPDDRRPPERPRSEPEIIPPDREGTRGKSDVWVWVAGRDGMRRANITLPGPFTIFLVLALVALVAGVILLLLVGAVLIWIPVVILGFGALFIFAAIRQYWVRFQRWAARR